MKSSTCCICELGIGSYYHSVLTVPCYHSVLAVPRLHSVLGCSLGPLANTVQPVGRTVAPM